MMWRRQLILFILTFAAAGCAHGTPDYKEELQQRGLSFSEQAFWESVNKGDEVAVELFLNAGMDPDVKDEQEATPLMYCAGAGLVEIASLLVEKGAALNVRDREGKTALDYATIDPGNGVFDLLVRRGALYGSSE
ncbi:ankyrin repeat domain-containing protein [Acidobacteria bacterium AH-259-D05]|nr:ankyrin repeat domain-containing protein [Acidobacteria bacterium AH-259-D05]